MKNAEIIIREQGCTEPASVSGLALGFDADGRLIVEDVGLRKLTDSQRVELAEHMRRELRRLRGRAGMNGRHAVH